MQSSLSQLQSTSKANPGIILYFNDHPKQQKKLHNCIFCGNTSTLQKFKGKKVCSDCLQSIPDLFAVSTIMSQNSR